MLHLEKIIKKCRNFDISHHYKCHRKYLKVKMLVSFDSVVKNIEEFAFKIFNDTNYYVLSQKKTNKQKTSLCCYV